MRALVAIGALLVSTNAMAGDRLDLPVRIDTTNHIAYGALGSAGNSLDGTQYIGCWIEAWAMSGLPATPRVTCQAQDATGLVKSCSSSATQFIQAVQAASGDVEVYFMWDDSYNCTYIAISNISHFAPRQP
jgi:hypothetical protein